MYVWYIYICIHAMCDRMPGEAMLPAHFVPSASANLTLSAGRARADPGATEVLRSTSSFVQQARLGLTRNRLVKRTDRSHRWRRDERAGNAMRLTPFDLQPLPHVMGTRRDRTGELEHVVLYYYFFSFRLFLLRVSFRYEMRGSNQ